MSSESLLPEQDSDRAIVAAIDGSGMSHHAAAWAAVDAALRGWSLELICSAAPQTPYGPAPVVSGPGPGMMRAEGEEILAEAMRIAREATGGEPPPIATEVTVDPIIPRLITRSEHARMLVVGSHGYGGLRGHLLGSVSSAMVYHAHCPVTVVRVSSATDAVSMRRPVLVGVDGTANSVPAVTIAFEEASLRNVGLVALHAWSDATGYDIPAAGWEAVREHEGALLSESLAGYREQYPDVPVRRIVVREHPARSLIAESEKAQLVVLGSHGRGGFAGMLLGSTSMVLTRSALCPVTVVRHSGQ
ncbi:universal stress protein [Nocardia vaccinii]|uniref:universal stress protein n=1 Tax=Nocardia vaccinii TaxID=1822 RepID=UPI000835A905|nr:universal stress protein [Nocardia vaccinii]